MSAKKNVSKVVTKSKTVEEKYKKKTPHEHILDLPDTYIGGISVEPKEMWVIDSNGVMDYKEIEYIPGLYKIFDELIVNCRDQTERTKACNMIRITIDQKNNTLSFYNNGSEIPVVIHKEHNVYIPEMIFAHLLTSENYDKDEEKTVGGKNGYGAKLANIFSTEFTIEVFDSNRLLYVQTCRKNMYEIEKDVKPKKIPVTNKSYVDPYVKITCKPDLAKFGIDKLSDDMVSLFRKRVYDISACTPTYVKVYLNDELVKINNFKDYITDMYYSDEVNTENEGGDEHKLIYEEHPRWKIGVMYDRNSGYRHVSYVNGICTFQGGSHVNHVVDQIVKGVTSHINTKNKELAIRPSQIKDNITVFIDSVIVNPSFGSQTKEYLNTKVNDFGSKCEISEDLIKRLCRTNIIKDVINVAAVRQLGELKKSDGKKVGRLYDIPKLTDAIDAGGRNSKDCTLILTEGDSAKPFAVSGLRIVGNQKFGVFPLKGKLLNVRDASIKQLTNNKEIKIIKEIMGLKHNKEYKDTSELRYGHILILTDQDLDGFHIKGLLINFINYFWPSLAKIDGFIQSLATPIIKAWKKSDTKMKNVNTFYTIPEYEKWKKDNSNTLHLYKTKYFKGLGTSGPAEAKECFLDFEKKVINYIWGNNKDEDTDSETNSSHPCQKAISLAFSEKHRNDRKRWLANYNKNDIIENNITSISYVDFVHKELKHFSNFDNIRSLPCVMDGLKPSQRKVLYGCILKGIYKDEIKVAQLSGFISDKTHYHHGEQSLQGTIINMAQNYPGSNNVNLLEPLGMFGYRRNGGVASSPRYINTLLSPLVDKIFRPEDNNVLTYVDDDGTLVEPVSYAPIVPMILCNHIEGIGTGFSTKIHPYNFVDVINNTRRLIGKLEPMEMIPYYRGFKGKMIKESPVKYLCKGTYEILNKTTVKLREIPINWGIEDYLAELSKMIVTNDEGPSDKKFIKSYQEKGYLNKISIKIEFVEGALPKLVQNNTLEKALKLTSNINLTNIHANTLDYKVKKYTSINDILREFYNFRLEMYEKRKAYLLKKLENEVNILKYKIMFLEYVLEGKIVIFSNNRSKPKDEILRRVKELGFPELSNKEDSEEKSYFYITNLLLFALTDEELEKLRKQFELKNVELEEYTKKPCTQIWLDELNELEKEYNNWLLEQPDDDAKLEDIPPDGKQVKKVVAKRKPVAKKVSKPKAKKV